MLELITNLLTNLINKSLMFVFFFGCLYILRHLFIFTSKVKNGEKYIMTSIELKLLGASIALIITIIMSGIKLI